MPYSARQPRRHRLLGTIAGRLALVLAHVPVLVACLWGCGGGSGGGEDVGPPPAPGAVERGPQVALVDVDSALIAWLTSGLALGGVEYGLDAALGQSETDASAVEEHAIQLTGLLPGTRYQYRIVVDGLASGGLRSFVTAPASDGEPVRFAVFGDSGNGSVRQREVAAQVLASEPDLVLITGDVIYDAGRPGELDPHYFEPYAGLIDRFPFYPALGNHDVLTDGGRPLLAALYLPVNDEDGTERYYSFDRGGVHFVALDSNTELAAGSAQRVWLERDLERSDAAWKMVYFHHPPYSSSSHGSSLSLRQELRPLFDLHEVDLVFNGHDHDYERTFPLRGEAVVDAASDPDYVRPGGTVYVVTGGGGQSLYPSGRSYFTARSESTHHFVLVEISGSSLALEAIRSDGTVFDRLGISK